MKHFLKLYRESRIVHKMIKRILLVGIICLGLTVLLYYQFYWNNLKHTAVNNSISTNLEIANQINANIENLTDTSQYIVNSADLMNKLSMYYREPGDYYSNDINLMLSGLISSMHNIRAVYIDGPDDMQFHSLDSLWPEDIEQLSSDNYQEVHDQKHTVGYSPIYSVITNATTYYLLTYYYNFNIGSRNFTMTIFFNATSMVSSICNLTATSFDGCVLSNYQQDVFFQTGDVGSQEEIAKENYTYKDVNYLEYKDGYYFSGNIATPKWNIVSYMNRSTLFGTFLEQFIISLVLCVLMTVFLIIALIPVLYCIIQPVNDLNLTMQEVVKGNLNCYSSIQTDDEIGDLSNVYNKMIDSLNRHIETILRYQEKEQKMIYNLLIAQIDTHFIYNTMSIINSFARQGKTQEIITANSALIKIMQNCLRVKTIDVTDTVEREMDVVKQYWIIENMRYENEVELLWDIPKTLYKENIPKNLIQPIVENCLFHGLVDEETGVMMGTITVLMRKTDNYLQLRISDNGCGFPSELLLFLNNPGEFTEKLNERGKHIGLANIRQRLSYIYGKDQNVISIYNDHGAVVEMHLPIA